MQKGPQILLAPCVVDDEQDAALAQRLAKLRGGGVEAFERRAFAGERFDEIGDDGEQIAGLFAEFHPEDAVEIGLDDVRVMGERLGERGLAVAARPAQRRRYRYRIAQRRSRASAFSAPNSSRAMHEIRRRFGHHHRHALLLAGQPQHAQQSHEMFRLAEVVNVAKPARHSGKIEVPARARARLLCLPVSRAEFPDAPPGFRARPA